VYVVAVETPSRQQTEQNNTHNGIGNQHLRRGALGKNNSSFGEHQSNKKYPISKVCLWAPVKRGRLQKGSGVRGGGVTNVNGITNYCISVCRESGDGQNAQFTGNKLWCFETCQLLLTIYYWFFIWTRKHCEFYFKNIIILDSCFLFFKGKEYDGIIVLVS